MIQANLLLSTGGRRSDSFINLDLMRLPLGILTGMGFIGAGVVLRRKDRVVGITTAATLWLVTVVGLCFGGGQIFLGITATALALFILEGLWRVDRSIHQDRHALLVAILESQGPSNDEIAAILKAAGFWIVSFAVSYSQPTRRRRVACEVHWRGRVLDFQPPEFLELLAQKSGVVRVRWKP
jgi:putative Mg2+ transporter-C (MgtC) family protein